jgi:hypothetical protein
MRIALVHVHLRIVPVGKRETLPDIGHRHFVANRFSVDIGSYRVGYRKVDMGVIESPGHLDLTALGQQLDAVEDGILK